MSGYHLMKIIVAVLLVVWVCIPIAHAQPKVFFMPSDHKRLEKPPEVTSQADFPAICSAQGGLKGLDLVRGFAGAATCPQTRPSTQFDVDMDLIILVDDTRSLSKYMQQMLAEQNLLQPYKGRQIVRPRVVSLANKKGGDSGYNLLVVGEMAFRQLGRDAVRWFVSLADRTGNTACELPAEELRTIEKFSTELTGLNISLQTTMLQALNNFATAMTFASSYDAEPRIGAALMQTAFSEAKSYAVGKLSVVVPGFGIAVALYDGAQDEIERAGLAGQSHAMSRWIQSSRDTITNCTGMYRCDGASGASRTKMSEVDIRETIELEICRLPENRHEAGMESIDSALNKLLVRDEPGIKAFEKDIFERWIDGYYDESAALLPGSLQGTIEILWKVDSDFQFDSGSYSAIVNVEKYGKNAEDSLNAIINARPDINGPLDFKVRKRVCFELERSTIICSLLDKDSSILRRGVGATNTAAANRALTAQGWRNATKRFVRR